jgi:ribonuclease HII
VPRSVGPTLDRERECWAAGRLLVGVDEVGRGPLAGPVVAAAVVFRPAVPRIRDLRDSKMLNAGAREALLRPIRRRALVIGVGAASVREIDRLNIRVATALAMRRALARVLPSLEAWDILVDGLPFPEIGHPHEALVKGDALCMSIAAAGIVAKQVRDGLMGRLARRHPAYGWDANMGYGTPSHQAGLLAVGPCRHHRRSFAPVMQLTLGLAER